MMKSYYAHKLSGERLKRCYEIAPVRIQQYLQAEVSTVLGRIHAGDLVLDLGCGYGRIIPQLAQKAGFVVGIDVSYPSLSYGMEYLKQIRNCLLLEMDAARLTFFDASFDVVVCVQNGISAFHVSPLRLMCECLRVVKSNGTVVFSTYSEKIWEDRLEWFHRQANEGLIGEIDDEKTRKGVIVCKDGFRAVTFTRRQFLSLTSKFKVSAEIFEADESSLFCVVIKHKGG